MESNIIIMNTCTPTRLWYYRPFYMHVRTRKYTTLHLNCLRKIRRQYKMPDTEVPTKTTKQRAHAFESSQSLHSIAMLYDGRIRNYQRKGFIMNIRRESIFNVADEMPQIYPNHRTDRFQHSNSFLGIVCTG